MCIMELACRPVKYLEIRINVFHETRKEDFNYPELFCNQGRRKYGRKKSVEEGKPMKL